MITTIEINHAKERLKGDYKEDFLNVELWEDDNVCFVYEPNIDMGVSPFEFEITKEHAVQLAKFILSAYLKK